jgi:hypothetical protein
LRTQRYVIKKQIFILGQKKEVNQLNQQIDEKKKFLRMLDTINFDEKEFNLEDDTDVKVIIDFIFLTKVQILIALVEKTQKRKQDIALLGKMFQEFSFFQKITQKLSQNAFLSMIKKLKHEYHPKREIVFRKGIFSCLL